MNSEIFLGFFALIGVMKQDKKGYEGFWKHFGCTLSIIVMIVFISIFLIILNMLFFKIQF